MHVVHYQSIHSHFIHIYKILYRHMKVVSFYKQISMAIPKKQTLHIITIYSHTYVYTHTHTVFNAYILISRYAGICVGW